MYIIQQWVKFMKKYILVDTANLFFKSRHFASRAATDDEKIGMAMHLTLTGVNSIIRKYGAENTHVVFCLEGRSWRKAVYAPYKANRAVKHASLTEKEVELDRMFWETYDAFTTFLTEKTNVSVLRCPTAEADDLIARFVHLHPDDEHTIVSSDGDFAQLITTNVRQYNSMAGHLITIDGYYDDRGREVKDKKTGELKKLGDPKFLLFEKCMRGDTSDNVFSAFPGVRTKSTKKTVGLIEAFEDRERKGFNWNNMMLQRWVDHNGVEHKVLDDYNRNVELCDLTAQPQEVKDVVDQSIRDGVSMAHVAGVGINLMKFCSKYDLTKIGDSAEQYARWLNSAYSGVLRD
jgi:5'-3' exonuclease